MGQERDTVATGLANVRASARRLLGQEAPGTAEPEAPTPGALTAISLLGAVQDLHALILLALAVDIAHSLGTSTTAVGFAVFLQLVLAPLFALGLARWLGRRVSWDVGALGGGIATVLLLGLTSLVTSGGQIVLMSLLVAAASAPGVVLHTPLGVESHPGPRRGTAVATYWTSRLAGATIGLLLGAALLTGPGLTWRGVLATLTVLGVAALVVVGLRFPFAPPAGAFDERPIRALVTGGHEHREPPDLGLFETIRRVVLVPSVKRLTVVAALLGAFTAPFVVFTFGSLTHEWVLSLGEELGVAGGIWAVGAAGTAWFSARVRRDRPTSGLPPLAARAALVGAIVVAGSAFVGILPVWIPLLGGGVALIGVTAATTHTIALSLVETAARPALSALLCVLSGSAGGLGGLLLLGGMDQRFGRGGALMATALVGVVLALVLRRIEGLVADDVDRYIEQIVDEAELRQRRDRGEHIPMLRCQGIDFSYGQLQVLFDVDFTVDDGEMVALLGTNGAGKSTLLKVISGLGLPSRGGVHFRGEDLTYLDAERRLTRGIAQIPGGEAVFPPLSVVENLRVFGHALGRDRAAVDRGIMATLEAFPRLDERRNQLASTLSGGEQQMLALGKAFIIRPRLLLIDELSLGLAPIIVGPLLEMVRRINEQGTAVVLVEQSVNVALSLVEHAYFMEKGEIRFDGAADELLERRDLLRSVFLEGVAEGFK